jgi:hypothetical protein
VPLWGFLCTEIHGLCYTQSPDCGHFWAGSGAWGIASGLSDYYPGYIQSFKKMFGGKDYRGTIIKWLKSFYASLLPK